MEPFFADVYEHLARLHAEMEAVIQGLPQEALDWRPAPQMNSLAVLAAHIAGAQRYMMGDVITGESSDRDREAEFTVQGLDGQALQALLSGTLAYTYGVLSSLSLEDLHAPRLRPRDQAQVTAGWALVHALEHTAQHAGEMQALRALWGAQHA
jgi:uncharacterized damage-inducible protein DinB